MTTTTASTSPMTVAQARKVCWLRTNPRPLGELLDAGYLNEQRLAWAAEKAYNPELKAAAGVLLAHVRDARWTAPQRAPQTAEPLELSLTEAEARATLWPFPPHKNRPMGELSDTRQLSLKDLGYAIDNAWDRRVRDAAILLMAQRLRQAVAESPDADGPPATVSGGRSYSERREHVWVMITGSVFTLLAIALLLALFFSIRTFVRGLGEPLPEAITNPTPSSVLAMLTVIVAMLVIVWVAEKLIEWVFDAVVNQVQTHRRGHDGEVGVLDLVRQNLDGNWTVFRNLELPARKAGDIDLVLVGPSGVWVLEVKNFQGEYRNYGEHWDYRAGKRWKPLGRRSPSIQARSNAVHLADFLRADGIRQYVEPAVVWANAETVPQVDQPIVPVWTLDRLPDELGNLDRGRKLDEAAQAQIVEKLTDLCRRQAEGDTDTKPA